MKMEAFFIVLFALVYSVSLVVNANAHDVNGDGYANCYDLVLVGKHFEETGPLGWIPEDVNEDGRVNILDAGAVAIQIRMIPTVIDCMARYGHARLLTIIMGQE